MLKIEIFSPILPRMPTNQMRVLPVHTSRSWDGSLRVSQGKTCLVDKPYLENSWFGTSLVPRDQTGRAQMQVVILVPRLNNLGTRPQERSILCSRAQCMRMSSIDMGLDYDSTVMLTCKLLFVCPGTNELCLLDFLFLHDQGGRGLAPMLWWLDAGIRMILLH